MVAGNEQERQGAEPDAKVFISYSRKDMLFADRLEAALRARNFEPLIDRAEIYAFEDWWERIKSLISKADTIVFVLSPDAVASEICAKEVEYAASLNKRFAPIVCQRTDDTAIPEPLRRLNFIFCDEAARFEASADQLAEALRTDIGWVRQHTEFGALSQRWATAGRPGPRGLLLRSPILDDAELWMASRPRGAPVPTEETQAFIIESRRAANRRRNTVTGGLAAALLVALALAAAAYWQRGKAIEQRRVAESGRITTLAALSSSERLRGNWDTAMRLAVHVARLALAADDNAEISAPRQALATAVWQSDLRLTLSVSKYRAYDAVFSSDGTKVLVISRDGIRLLDASNGQQIAARHDDVSPGDIESDGIADGGDPILFRAHGGFSPDGALIADRNYIYDAHSGRELLSLDDGTQGHVNSGGFSPDGKRIVTASESALWPVSAKDNNARIWDATTGKPIIILRGHDGAVLFAGFSPDGTRVVTASSDRTARLWDATTGKELFVLRAHEGDVNFAGFSPDGTRVVTASSDRTARVWDAVTGKEISVLRGHDASVNSAVFSPDGMSIVTASSDNTARIWNTESATAVSLLGGHADAVRSANFSPDGKRVVTASLDGSVRIWDATGAEHATILRGHDGEVKSSAFSPDGTRIATASPDRTVRIWDVASGEQLGILRGHTDTVNSAAFSPDGIRIATGSNDKTLRLWDATTGKEISVDHVSGAVQSVNFLSNPTETRAQAVIIAGVWDYYSVVHAWTLGPDEEELRQEISDLRFDDSATRLNSAAWGPDRHHVVIATDHGATVYDGLSKLYKIVLDKNAVNSAAFSPDGTRVVTALPGRLARIWDGTFPPNREYISEGKEIAALQGHLGDVNSAAFGPDGSLIVTGSSDNTARIWDAVRGKEIVILRGHTAAVNSVAFSPDGKRVVTASSDRTARIWRVDLATMPVNELIAEVCGRRLRGLTTLSRDEMRLAGYPDETPEMDVCAGVQ